MFARLRSYARNLRRRGSFEDAMDEEMRFHVESRAEDLVRRGVAPAEAARRARLEFGSVEKQKDLARASVGIRLLDELRGDLRYAFRTFARNKGFAAAAVITLALGIGANTAIFSLIDALLLRMLPVHRPQDLLSLSVINAAGRGTSESVSYPLITALDREKDIFDGVAGFSAASRMTVGTGTSMALVSGTIVTGAFYETLGLTPALGRLLTRADDAAGAPVVAVVSYGYWERSLARDPGIVGRTLIVQGIPAEIVGVSPRGFVGANVGATADLTIPASAVPATSPQLVGLLGPGNSWLRVLARPRPGLSADAVTARLVTRWPQIAAQAVSPTWSATRKQSLMDARLTLHPGGTGWTFLRDVYGKPLQVLMAVVALVLLVACANIASLLLARAHARRREIGVRLAIGAGRARLIRQLLVESLLLSVAGAAAGVLIATTCGRLIVDLMATPRTPIQLDLTPNWHVLAFTAAVAVVTAILFGIAPALQSTNAGPADVLKEDARTATFRSRLLPLLVAAQMALSLVILIGAGLFIRTLHNLHTVNPGFAPNAVLLVGLERRPDMVPASVLDDIRRLPGVVSASLSTHTPLSGATWSEPVVPAGQALPERDTALCVGASPGFFTTLGIPVVAGREFTDRDTHATAAVAVVNEQYASHYFPGQSALGKRLAAMLNGKRGELEIVGVVKNVSTAGLRKAAPPMVYLPYAQLTGNVVTNVEVKASGFDARLSAALRQMLQPLQPTYPVEVSRLASQVEGTLVQERMMAMLGTGFGLLALVLAAVGTYGLLAYGATRRTREIGIRMALGAERRSVAVLILGGALRPLVAGLLIGVPAALLTGRGIESMLFGLKGTDPLAIAGATLLLAAVAHAAALIPALRASRVDPLVALRHE